MKIVADIDLPLVKPFFESLGELILKPGRSITRKDLLDADILLVRTVTAVNQALLHATNVRFVGSATAGADHLDTQWMDEAGIEWSVACACNAKAVMEHVVCVIASLQKQGFLTGKNLRAGVIGVGSIGREIVKILKMLGFEVVLCDPILAEREKKFSSSSLDDLRELDLITLHVPLTQDGKHSTFHLIEKKFLQRQKPNCVLINTSRGAVMHSEDLLQYGQHLLWCLDVWENEPDIDFNVVDNAFIATPHIAGHSLQSKYRAMEMIYRAIQEKKIIHNTALPVTSYPMLTLSFNQKLTDWREVVLKVHEPMKISEEMKHALIENVNSFDELRKKFSDRHEFSYVTLTDIVLSEQDRKILKTLGFQGV